VIAPLRYPEFDAPHAFTTRPGGVSDGPYASLNLGLSSGDLADRVAANRERMLASFGSERSQVAAFHQVHGDRVAPGAPTWFDDEADAAVTADGTTLVISVADCFPILFYDPENGAVGAAHCGWRGSIARLAAKVVATMTERFGTDPSALQVAIGPGIRGPCYQVGAEVVAAFDAAEFPATVARPDDEGRFRLDLVAANRHALIGAGVAPERIVDTGLCTHCDAERFFSHRRDAGRTGRHWALIRRP
jgi:YfiH family protein